MLRKLLPRVFLPALVLSSMASCISISDLEVVQAVQTPKNGVPMVALKPTFVRVYVQSVETWHGPWQVDARLTVKDAVAGTQHELAPINPTPITVATNGGRRDEWGQSFTFLLDRIDTYPGTKTLEVRVFEVGASASNPPRTAVLSRDWIFHPPVYDSSYGVVWAVTNTNDSFATPVGPAAPWSDFAAHVAFTQSVFPVSGYSVVPLPGVGYAAPNPQPFGNLTQSRTWASQMLANLPPGSKINLLDNWDTGGLHGYAWGTASEEQNARTDGRVGSTMAQEVSHNNGLWCHTFDVCTLYTQYPHESGLIDRVDIGFNVSGNFGRADPQLVSSNGQRDANDVVSVAEPTADYMSYSYPTWVSSFTYCMHVSRLWKAGEAACSYAHSHDFANPRIPSGIHEVVLTPLPKPIPPEESVFVAGVLEPSGRGEFTAFERVPQGSRQPLPSMHADERPLTLQIVGADGARIGEVAVITYGTHPQTDPKGDHAHTEHAQTTTLPFSAFIPARLITERAATLRIMKGDSMVTERALSREAPTVRLGSLSGRELAGIQTLTWSAEASEPQALRSTLLFSADNGEHWWPINVGIPGTSAAIDADQLPGSERALFKVRTSNFGRSTESAAIGPYRIASKRPTVSIQTPADGATVYATQTILARASAFSWQDGALTSPQSFHWQIDDNRQLGDGDWCTLRNLAPGEHTLRVTARDYAGLSADAVVRFTVTARPRAADGASTAPAPGAQR